MIRIFVSSHLVIRQQRVVRVYKGSGDRPGTPIRGQVIDRSHEYAAGNRQKSPIRGLVIDRGPP